MPTYVYKFVKTGETIEVEQSFADDALTTAVHPRTKRKMAVKKVFTPVGVTFRGDGFYKTDSRSSSKSKKSSAGSSESTSESTSESKSDSTTKPSESKGDSKATASASSSSD
jgi:predicted nucleic acid-binding Zn ribbon protein